jgi:dynein light chain 1, axonemal
VKDAIKNFEEKYGMKGAEAEHVKLYAQYPPIEKMDANLGTLKLCKHLALSTNSIERIGGLTGLDHLEILSLGRNQIKKIEGVEGVAGTLKQLWISYNNIEKLAGIGVLKNLEVLYMSNNKVAAWGEFEKLQELPNLQELLFIGNPLEEKHSKDGDWRIQVIKRLPNLKKLDGNMIEDEEREQAQS